MGERVPIQEAVERTGISRSTLDRWRRLKALNTYRARGTDPRVYVDLDEIAEVRRNPPLRQE